jgi:hypothetical protein
MNVKIIKKYTHCHKCSKVSRELVQENWLKFIENLLRYLYNAHSTLDREFDNRSRQSLMGLSVRGRPRYYLLSQGQISNLGWIRLANLVLSFLSLTIFEIHNVIQSVK